LTVIFLRDRQTLAITHFCIAIFPVDKIVSFFLFGSPRRILENVSCKVVDLFLKFQKLVAKPDQLIKRRGKLGLIKVNTDFAGAKAWILERLNKDTQVGRATGKLRTFIIEPFLPHKPVSKPQVVSMLVRFQPPVFQNLS